ncbi:MAG TPA: hypothetical protein VMU84_17435 [Thermoanaerobaculia bacterium]|nr:hypothetical protein [Thermoanaerobaculia bacterium]
MTRADLSLPTPAMLLTMASCSEQLIEGPPMPFEHLTALTDDDLKTVAEHLRNLQPIESEEPDPAGS